MNWLAHLHLGGPDALERLGNLAGDFVRGTRVDDLAPPVRRGVLAHRRIDGFTDAHPIVIRSRARLGPPYGRYGGVLVDVFYDHLLAQDWPRHATEAPPLRDFVDTVHDDLHRHRDALPPLLRLVAPRMIEQDWLGSYGTVDGLRGILARMERRLRRPMPLAAATDELVELRPALADDFEEFYPELREFAATLSGAR